MHGKKAGLLSGFTVSRLMCLIVILGSFGLLEARPRHRVQSLVYQENQNSGVYRTAKNPGYKAVQNPTVSGVEYSVPSREGQEVGSSEDAYSQLSYINRKFHDFANALFSYDAQIASAKKELAGWEACLDPNAPCRGFSRYNIHYRAKYDASFVRKMIASIKAKIDELTANKNRIVTIQSALKKYWYALVPIIAAGGAGYMVGKMAKEDNKEENKEDSYVGQLIGRFEAARLERGRMYDVAGHLWSKHYKTAEDHELIAQRDAARDAFDSAEEELVNYAKTPGFPSKWQTVFKELGIM